MPLPQPFSVQAAAARVPLYRRFEVASGEHGAVLLLDAEGRVLARDAAFCALAGLPADALMPGSWLGLLAERSPLLATVVEMHAGGPIEGREKVIGGLHIGIRPLLGNALLVQARPTVDGHRASLEATHNGVSLAAAGVGGWHYRFDTGRYQLDTAWLSWLGYPSDSDPIYESLVHPEDLPLLQQARSACLGPAQQAFSCELRLRTTSGEWRQVLSRGRAVTHATPPYLVGADIDLSELKACAGRQALLAGVVNVIPHGVMIADVNGRIQSVNAAFSAITGYDSDEVIGQSTDILNSGIHHAVFFQHMWSAVNRRGSWSGEVWNRRKNGEVYPEWMTLICLRDRSEHITHYAAVFEDITERKQQEERMARQAYHDPLTDLPNRLLFTDRLEQAIAHARRTREMVGVLFVDLDGFKPVNDENGHDVGDMLLKQFAQRLTACVRSGDTVARLAGDEFTLIVPHMTCHEDIEPIAQKVLVAACQPFHVAGRELRLSASIGISLFPLHGDNSLKLVKHADQAMYRAKHAGRCNWQFFEC